LQSSDATVFFNVTTPKFAAQSIRRAYDIGWRPVQFSNSVGSSTGAVMKPGGLERAQGLFSAHYQKDATDPRRRDDKGIQEAADLRDLELPMLLPGIKVNTSPSNFFPVKRMQLVKFEGDG
jgi:branched-chain amino acid transport system substrate-binding protein